MASDAWDEWAGLDVTLHLRDARFKGRSAIAIETRGERLVVWVVPDGEEVLVRVSACDPVRKYALKDCRRPEGDSANADPAREAMLERGLVSRLEGLVQRLVTIVQCGDPECARQGLHEVGPQDGLLLPQQARHMLDQGLATARAEGRAKPLYLALEHILESYRGPGGVANLQVEGHRQLLRRALCTLRAELRQIRQESERCMARRTWDDVDQRFDDLHKKVEVMKLSCTVDRLCNRPLYPDSEPENDVARLPLVLAVRLSLSTDSSWEKPNLTGFRCALYLVLIAAKCLTMDTCCLQIFGRPRRTRAELEASGRAGSLLKPLVAEEFDDDPVLLEKFTQQSMGLLVSDPALMEAVWHYCQTFGPHYAVMLNTFANACQSPVFTHPAVVSHSRRLISNLGVMDWCFSRLECLELLVTQDPSYEGDGQQLVPYTAREAGEAYTLIRVLVNCMLGPLDDMEALNHFTRRFGQELILRERSGALDVNLRKHISHDITPGFSQIQDEDGVPTLLVRPCGGRSLASMPPPPFLPPGLYTPCRFKEKREGEFTLTCPCQRVVYCSEYCLNMSLIGFHKKGCAKACEQAQAIASRMARVEQDAKAKAQGAQGSSKMIPFGDDSLHAVTGVLKSNVDRVEEMQAGLQAERDASSRAGDASAKTGRKECCVCRQELEKLKHCARCLSRRYCSSACQSADWKHGHKHQCKEMAAARAEMEAKGMRPSKGDHPVMSTRNVVTGKKAMPSDIPMTKLEQDANVRQFLAEKLAAVDRDHPGYVSFALKTISTLIPPNAREYMERMNALSRRVNNFGYTVLEARMIGMYRAGEFNVLVAEAREKGSSSQELTMPAAGASEFTVSPGVDATNTMAGVLVDVAALCPKLEVISLPFVEGMRHVPSCDLVKLIATSGAASLRVLDLSGIPNLVNDAVLQELANSCAQSLEQFSCGLDNVHLSRRSVLDISEAGLKRLVQACTLLKFVRFLQPCRCGHPLDEKGTIYKVMSCHGFHKRTARGAEEVRADLVKDERSFWRVDCEDDVVSASWYQRDLEGGQLQFGGGAGADRMVVGAHVVLHSMKTLALNGCQGKIARWDEETGRFEVAFEEGGAKAIKPTNLRVVPVPSSLSEGD